MHVQIDRVTKTYGTNTVLKETSLSVERGEVVCLLGPSGCGKTTLLRSIAGFVAPETGHIMVGGRELTGLPPNRRNVGMVFQSYGLFPHLSVTRNVAYGLEVRGSGRAEINERVGDALGLVGLTDFADRYPAQLSGGQQQRVAVARALVLEPEVLLLDEPFSALDAQLRGTMQVELRKLVKRLGMTAIFVTHDQQEALTLSDRIAVMHDGVIQQIGDPLEIYDAPQTHYVADFIGLANMLRRKATHGVVRIGDVEVSAPDGYVTIMVRPENLVLEPAEQAAWSGKVTFARPLGAIVEYEIDAGEESPIRVVSLRSAGERPAETGTEVGLRLRDPDSCRVLPEEQA